MATPKGFSEERQADLVPAPVQQQVEHFRATLGPGGRIVIPAAIRRRMEIKEGDALVGTVDGKEVKLRSLNELILQAQEITQKYVPEGVSLVDEFLKERRAMWGEED